MILTIDVQFEYAMDHETDLIVQVQAADLADQRVVSQTVQMSPVNQQSHVVAEAGIGTRTLLRTSGNFLFQYHAVIDVVRPAVDLATLPATPLHNLPAEAVRFLMPSRYCAPDEVQAQVDMTFGMATGGALIAAMSDWIYDNFQYVIGASDAQTTALDTARGRTGVCRDYAHVLIALARANGIPARFVSAYAPDVTPQDFHAVVEVYLDGGWQLIDPTRMAQPEDIVRIGVGMDAAEVSFLSSFGFLTFVNQSVSVQRG